MVWSSFGVGLGMRRLGRESLGVCRDQGARIYPSVELAVVTNSQSQTNKPRQKSRRVFAVHAMSPKVINGLAIMPRVRDDVLKGSELSNSGGWERDRAFVRCVFQNALARPLRSLPIKAKSAVPVWPYDLDRRVKGISRKRASAPSDVRRIAS